MPGIKQDRMEMAYNSSPTDLSSIDKSRSVIYPIIQITVPYLLGVGLMVALWSLLASKFHITTFPSPLETLQSAESLIYNREIFHHAWISMYRILLGFGIGCIVAVPVGLFMGVNDTFRRMMEPVTEFFRFIPAIAMIVFAIVWFGVGETSKIFLISFNTVFIMVVATEAGVRSVSIVSIRAAEMMGASSLQKFGYVLFPATIPYVIVGMRIAMGRSFATIVAAEMLAASSGLGFMIFGAREFSRMDTVLVGILTLGVLGFIADYLFKLLAPYLAGEYADRA